MKLSSDYKIVYDADKDSLSYLNTLFSGTGLTKAKDKALGRYVQQYSRSIYKALKPDNLYHWLVGTGGDTSATNKGYAFMVFKEDGDQAGWARLNLNVLDFVDLPHDPLVGKITVQEEKPETRKYPDSKMGLEYTKVDSGEMKETLWVRMDRDALKKQGATTEGLVIYEKAMLRGLIGMHSTREDGIKLDWWQESRQTKNKQVEKVDAQGYVIKVSIPTSKKSEFEVNNVESPAVRKGDEVHDKDGRLYLNFKEMIKRHLGKKKK